MATNVIFTRGNTATINATAITDGQILYNTTTGTQYLDNGTTRLQIGQNITVDATLNSSSNNPIANSGVAGVMHTSLSEISTITQAGNIPDALAVKELNSKISGKVEIFPLPDWGNKISITFPYTVPSNGYLCLGGFVQISSSLANIIAGVFNYASLVSNEFSGGAMYPVAKNEVLTKYKSDTVYYAYFVPIK